MLLKMESLKKKKSLFFLKVFDKKKEFSARARFGKTIFSNSIKGFLWGIVIIFLIIGFDESLLYISEILYTFPNGSFACEAITYLDKSSYVKIIKYEYFSEVVSISAGILGVLLGLFYTAFLTIIATKYSNVNSIISIELLENKSLNKYFTLLSVLTSVSVLFQLLLSTGYQPTFISSLFFLIVIISALNSFIKYGKLTLIYFDISFLVNDIINECYGIIFKISAQKSNIDNLKKGKDLIKRIYRNIEKIELIINEAKLPHASNTSFDSISNELLKFSIFYNNFKHTIPSRKGWHLQESIPFNWEDAKEWNFNILRTTGVYALPKSVDSYSFIERRIIEAKLELFRQFLTPDKGVDVLLEEYQFSQVISFQKDFEVTSFFLNQFQKIILDKIAEYPDSNFFHLQLVSVYSKFLVAYIVGYNYQINVFSVTNLKKLASAIHNFKDTDKIIAFPYFIRIWMDKYQEKLKYEVNISGCNVTPLFFTEFELVRLINVRIQEFLGETIVLFTKIINDVTNSLKDKHKIEVLQFNMDSLEIIEKIRYGIDLTNSILDSHNELNFQKNDFLGFDNKMILEEKNEVLRELIINNIWGSGVVEEEITGYKHKIPDIQGAFYHIILNDIIDKLLSVDFDEGKAEQLLRKFGLQSIMYIQSISQKYVNEKNIRVYASKVYSPIVDLFEVFTIAFIVSKCLNKDKIYQSIFSFWDMVFSDITKEIKFWEFVHPIYDYISQPLYSFSSNSYDKEFDRLRKVKSFLIDNQIIRKEFVKHGGFSIVEHFVTDVDNIYVKAFVSSIKDGIPTTYHLHEVFIEFFLRNRITSKDINIKQTKYGRQVEYFMDKTKE